MCGQVRGGDGGNQGGFKADYAEWKNDEAEDPQQTGQDVEGDDEDVDNVEDPSAGRNQRWGQDMSAQSGYENGDSGPGRCGGGGRKGGGRGDDGGEDVGGDDGGYTNVGYRPGGNDDDEEPGSSAGPGTGTAGPGSVTGQPVGTGETIPPGSDLSAYMPTATGNQQWDQWDQKIATTVKAVSDELAKKGITLPKDFADYVKSTLIAESDGDKNVETMNPGGYTDYGLLQTSPQEMANLLRKDSPLKAFSNVDPGTGEPDDQLLAGVAELADKFLDPAIGNGSYELTSREYIGHGNSDDPAYGNKIMEYFHNLQNKIAFESY